MRYTFLVINQGYLRTQPIVRNHVPLGSIGKDVKPPSYLYGFFELILSSSTRQLCEQNRTAYVRGTSASSMFLLRWKEIAKGAKSWLTILWVVQIIRGEQTDLPIFCSVYANYLQFDTCRAKFLLWHSSFCGVPSQENASLPSFSFRGRN